MMVTYNYDEFIATIGKARNSDVRKNVTSN